MNIKGMFISYVEASVVPGLLLLLIHASGKEVGKERRDAIRATWASDIDTIADELDQDITYKYVNHFGTWLLPLVV